MASLLKSRAAWTIAVVVALLATVGVLGYRWLNPPDRVTVILAWDNGCVVKLATGIYQEQDFSPERMDVLAVPWRQRIASRMWVAILDKG
jgi:hypothetical protein